MKKIKGIKDYSWASFVFAHIEETTDELDVHIKQLEQTVQNVQKENRFGIGIHLLCEELFILKVIRQYKEESVVIM